MKKYIITLAICLFALTSSVVAADVVTIDNFSILPGETKNVNISLANESEYVAFQFDLYLPDSLTVESYSADRSRIPESTTLSMTRQQDGSYRFITMAINGDPITGTSGPIVNISVRAQEEMAFGERAGYFRNVKLSRSNATGPTYDEMSFPITIERPRFAIRYLVDGEIHHVDSVGYGLTITPLAALTKVGYTFSGWSDIPATMPANDVEVTGSFTENKYILTYKVDGADYKKDTLAYNTAITPLAALTKEGYTFSGWSDIPATMPAGDVEISGTFSVNSYNLVYIVDGKTYQSMTVEYGSSIIAESEPTKEGSTFSGWSGVPSTMPARDVEITGSFDSNSYKLIYKLDGEIYKSSIVKYGSEITAEPSPVREGYTFSGWSEIPATMPASDVEITGTFSVNSYNLVYKIGDETYKTTIVEYGSSIIAEPNPEKEGYTFSGWSEIPSTMPASDVVISGSLSINSYNLVYKVDGETYLSIVLQYGSSIAAEPDLSKEGYTFSGWSEIPTIMPANDVEVTGYYLINSYNLIYVIEGEEYKTITVEYGSSITLEPFPSKEGYTFSGWSDIPDIMPAKDVIVTGLFNCNTYSLVYMLDGEFYKSISVSFGSEIIPETEPVKDGYTFSGWSEIPSVMPAGDIVVSGLFYVNYHELRYKIDGEIYKTDSVAYGSTITAENTPVIVGYTFSGWDCVPETMPDHDVEISGSFTVNKYLLCVLVDGDVVFSDSIAFGTRLADYADIITKNGIDLSQWEWYGQIETITMPAHDVTINAVLDAVHHVKMGADESVIYDLTGKRIETDDITTLPAGIYIRNGRKFMVQ